MAITSAWVVTSSAVVGSSASSSRGLVSSAVLAQPPLAVLDADLAEHVHGAAAGLADRHGPGGAQRLGHEVADPPHRVDVRPRVLEDHRDLATVPAQRLPGLAADRPAVEQDLAVDLGAARQQPVDRAGGHRLARARFADQPERLAGPHGEADVPQHRPPGPLDGQPDGQALDLEQHPARGGLRHGHRRTA
jgi:hypothetical protein